MTNEELLIKAFDDRYYFDRVKKIKNEIEDQIIKLMDYIQDELEKEDDKNLNIFEFPQSRIKSAKSFKEKIKRKDYINTWEITDDTNQNRKMISYELTDLIGFRINCFFSDDEEKVFKLCQKYDSEKKFTNIICNFKENQKQKNGHIIYKWSGKYYSKEYDESYGFEVQIKSLVHNLWGEVEHKTIYKNQCLDVNKESKQSITNNIYDILQATNKQLLTLYTNKYSKDDLIKSLFYEYTYEDIANKFLTTFLACHYEDFFELLGEVLFEEVKKYVAYKILNEESLEYKKRKIDFIIDDKMNSFPTIMKKLYIEYDMRILYEISSILIDIKDYDEFLSLIGYYQYKEYEAMSSDEEIDDNVAEILASKLDKILHKKERA